METILPWIIGVTMPLILIILTGIKNSVSAVTLKVDTVAIKCAAIEIEVAKNATELAANNREHGLLFAHLGIKTDL